MRPLKLLALALAPLLLLPAISSPQAKETWKLLKPQGSIFSVLLPSAPPAPQTQSLSDPASGKIDVKAYLLFDGAYFYSVNEVKVERPDPNHAKVLRDFEGGFLGTSGTTLVSAQETKFKGYTARKMLFKKDTKRVQGLAFIVGDRLLAFFASAEVSQIGSAKVTKFFNSIKVNGK